MNTPELMSSTLPRNADSRAQWLASLIDFRRDIHRHPEVGHSEFRTTARVADALEAVGLQPVPIGPTGLVVDIGPPDGPALGLRADLDALPILDETDTEWASTNPGISHACGHDVHTTVLVGTAQRLAELARNGQLQHRVRLVFQPAEESKSGGAQDVIAAGGLDGVTHMVALHCDPGLDVGHLGLRTGPITSASDQITIHVFGPGGHTSRPHLTADVIFALGTMATNLPGILSRRLDPRAGASLVWGKIAAGAAANAIPRSGVLEGTLRCMQTPTWEQVHYLLPSLVEDLVAPFGVRVELEHHRGVPPVVNDAGVTALIARAVAAELGEQAIVEAEQSMGGEDFAWYLQHVPGSLARLGTRTPGGRTYDLHQGDFTVDEGCIEAGVAVMTRIALDGVPDLMRSVK